MVKSNLKNLKKMKIKVNVHQAENRRKQVVREIVAAAQDAAERGVNNFIYQFKEGERQSWAGHISSHVQEATEGTVKCAYRGDHGTWMKFVIC